MERSASGAQPVATIDMQIPAIIVRTDTLENIDHSFRIRVQFRIKTMIIPALGTIATLNFVYWTNSGYLVSSQKQPTAMLRKSLTFAEIWGKFSLNSVGTAWAACLWK
jgi:hypothetical protein